MYGNFVQKIPKRPYEFAVYALQAYEKKRYTNTFYNNWK